MTISIRRNKRDLSQSQVSREMLGVQFEPELSLKLGSSQDTAPRDEITKKQMTIFFNGEMRVLDVTETQVHFFSPLFFLSGQLDTPIVANAFESLIFAERYKLLECCWFVAYPYYKPKRHNCRKKKKKEVNEADCPLLHHPSLAPCFQISILIVRIHITYV